jgi:hypothetical protein
VEVMIDLVMTNLDLPRMVRTAPDTGDPNHLGGLSNDQTLNPGEPSGKKSMRQMVRIYAGGAIRDQRYLADDSKPGIAATSVSGRIRPQRSE